VVYVVDVSSSMIERIGKAKRELHAALSTLRPEESFDIVAFFADIQVFRGSQVPPTPDNIGAANAFVDKLDLEDGTNLEKAMLSALRRPGINLVVLITDGVPTQGQTKWKKLTREFKAENRNGARIFTIGLVGKDPFGKDQTFAASRLLQQIANDSNGEFKLYPLG